MRMGIIVSGIFIGATIFSARAEILAVPDSSQIASASIRVDEAFLKAHIESLRAGTPKYEEMASVLRRDIGRQSRKFQMMLNQLGPVKSIVNEGVKWDADIFTVSFEGGSQHWMIRMGLDGKLSILSPKED